MRTSAKPPLIGRKAVDAREYAAPTQTKSSPCKSWMILGRAVDTADSSIADKNIARQRERKIIQNFKSFLGSEDVGEFIACTVVSPTSTSDTDSSLCRDIAESGLVRMVRVREVRG